MADHRLFFPVSKSRCVWGHLKLLIMSCYATLVYFMPICDIRQYKDLMDSIFDDGMDLDELLALGYEQEIITG